jgi:16S rRNA (adenine1518-N6/adenine1519-N6)-dimethyltransferase
MKHIARKRFGQHFLTDRAIIDGIVDAINPMPGQPMVEIGPGLAALTQPLVERLGQLTVIELDRDLAVRLREHPHLTVIESDVLKVDFKALCTTMDATARSANEGPSDQKSVDTGCKLRVVGNLPYNISTPILFHLLDQVDVIEDQHFMLQKEVIDRMVASPCTSDYSRLSVMLQWRYEMANILFVPPSSFDPPPRVDSAIVRMIPLSAPPVLDVKTLSTLVQVAFSQRRKILRNTLGRWLDEQSFSGHFDLQRRAEEVPVDEYVQLVQSLSTSHSLFT